MTSKLLTDEAGPGQQTSGRLTYRVREAADALGLSVPMTYRLIAEGRLPCIRIGKAVRVPVARLEAFIAEAVAAGREL